MAQTCCAPQPGEVALACEHVCGVPCNLQVARDGATQQNVGMNGALLITQEEAAHHHHVMMIHALAMAAIPAALTMAAAREAAAARERREAEAAAQKAAAAREARAAQEAIVKKEAEVKALEQALAEETARKQAEMALRTGHCTPLVWYFKWRLNQFYHGSEQKVAVVPTELLVEPVEPKASAGGSARAAAHGSNR